ncbi:radical SAM protein [bacterium]|nr:radical SAM protein [bacterium]NIN92556.1 radical SAM protein [bacterium]NIO18598.1 radical SAM protein [bacterium]NIO73613.1 radical SAM protein [bacterium]
MKVLFVYPNLMRQENVSLGIAYLSACLKAHGHSTRLVDYTWGARIKDAISAVSKFDPNLVAFSVRSGEFIFCLKIARKLKKYFGGEPKIIFGGVHPTVAPEEVIRKDCVDLVCVGEGEGAMVELCQKMENKERIDDIKNIWVKKDGIIKKNDVRGLVEDLDEIPFPDRDIFDIERYISSRDGAIDMIVSRGCPYQCTYCINPILQNLYKRKGKFVRTRSVNNVVNELNDICKKYKIKHISFLDDVFPSSLEWLVEFRQKFPRNSNLDFCCNFRAESLNPEICRYLKDCGCSSINIGIESGSEWIREKVLNRRISNRKLATSFEICRKEGLATYSFNMIGIPYETISHIRESIELNKSIQPTFLQVSIFQPYHGTQLNRLCIEKKWYDGKILPYSHQFFSIVKYPQISRTRIYWEKILFRYRILKDRNFKKALLTLIYDYCFYYLTMLRALIPSPLKAQANRLFRSMQRKD